MITKLAWRNLWRHKRRTLLSVVGIGFAVAVLQFFMGIQLKSYDSAINASVSLYYGHLQIQPEGYLDDPEVRKVLAAPQALLGSLKSITDVKAAALRASSFALLSSEDRTYGAQIVGVEFDNEPHVSSIPGVIRQGVFFTSADAQQIIMGRALADNLRLRVGDSVTILGQSRDGSLAAMVLPLAGIFESGSRDLDRNIVEMPLRTFQENFGMEGAAHNIVVRARSASSLESLRGEISRIISRSYPNPGTLAPPVVLTWEELLPGLKESIELDMSFGWLFYFSLILVVTLSVANTLLMSVLERVREFGVMMSLGATPKRVAGLIVVESLLLGFLGVLIGTAFGVAVLRYYGVHGFSIPGTEEFLKIWNIPGAVFPEITFAVVSIAPCVLLLTVLLATIYPVCKVMRLTPVQALHAV